MAALSAQPRRKGSVIRRASLIFLDLFSLPSTSICREMISVAAVTILSSDISSRSPSRLIIKYASSKSSHPVFFKKITFLWQPFIPSSIFKKQSLNDKAKGASLKGAMGYSSLLLLLKILRGSANFLLNYRRYQ